MINNIKDWIQEHKGMLILSAILIVVFVLISIGILNFRHMKEQEFYEQEQQQQEQTSQGEEEQQASMSLSDEQLSVANNYDSNTSEVLALLKANVWTDGNEKSYIKFGNNYFVDSSTKQVKAFVVIANKQDRIQENNEVITTLSIETSDKQNSIMTVRKRSVQAVSGTVGYMYTVSCNLFSTSNDYWRTSSADYLQVDIVSDEVLQYINNDKQALISAVTDYCSLNYPTVTKVTFTGVIDIDTSEQVKVINFACNNKANSKIQVVYTSNNEFYVSEGNNAINK